MNFLLKLLLNPTVLLWGVVAIGGGALLWVAYSNVYNSGMTHERAAWVLEREEAAAKREAERAAAQREQGRLASELVDKEIELGMEQQDHADELTRALAVNSADMAACRVFPDAIMRPFRAVGSSPKASVGSH